MLAMKTELSDGSVLGCLRDLRRSICQGVYVSATSALMEENQTKEIVNYEGI